MKPNERYQRGSGASEFFQLVGADFGILEVERIRRPGRY